MGLIWWWVIPLGLLMGAAGLYFMLRHGGRMLGAVTVAHSERLTALPKYQELLRRYRFWLGVAIVSALIAAGALLIAGARPVSSSVQEPVLSNRDIMLCLDISGSMMSTDQHLVTSFEQLAKSFKGERIGLSVFDSSSVMVFPLTDDYTFVEEQLKTAAKSLDPENPNFDFFEGSYEGGGASLIGDGVASCVTSFSSAENDGRSRSIILATDNQLAGRPLFTLAEAAALAQKNKVRIYALDPTPQLSQAEGEVPSDGLRAAAATSGGSYYPLPESKQGVGTVDQATVNGVVGKIQATHAQQIKSPPRLLVIDRPEPFLLIAMFFSMVTACAMWRLRP